jgi:HD-like signal output (HDOD) protein
MPVADTGGLEDLIDRTVSVPTIPSVLVRVDRVLSEPDSAAAEVAQAISNDPALASKVLRIANSAYYGLKAQVTSLDLAVALLGFKIVRNIVVTATLLEAFSDVASGVPVRPEEFWKHSMRAAVAGKMIHTRILKADKSTADDAYIAGLLHDLGKLVLLDGTRRAYFDLVQGALAAGCPLVTREDDSLGFNHTDVGALLATRWNLPATVVAAIQGHHQPPGESHEPKTAALAHVADYVAKTRGRPEGFCGGEDPFFEEALEIQGLTPADLSQIVFLFESEDRGLDFPVAM